jgi:hypothetical protein
MLRVQEAKLSSISACVLAHSKMWVMGLAKRCKALAETAWTARETRAISEGDYCDCNVGLFRELGRK